MSVLSLSSSSLNISKPSFDFLPLSNKHKSRPSLSVSCSRATKLETSHGNLYKILSLSPKSATMDDIKRAYRSMALKYHPDVCSLKKEESTKMFLQLNAAYKTLSNPRLRAEYDYELGLMMRSEIMGGGGGGDESWRRRWMEQVAELKRRSERRRAHKEKGDSWGSRMRAQNMMNKHHHQI